MAKTTFNIQEKIKYLELIEKVLCKLEDKKDYVHKDYTVIGKKTEQATDWKTGELLWEDEDCTIPKYENEWGYIKKTELTDADRATLSAIDRLIEDLKDLC